MDVQVMRDREAGVSRGFGFVTFSCSFMAEAALEHKPHFLNDKEFSESTTHIMMTFFAELTVVKLFLFTLGETYVNNFLFFFY